MKPGVDADRGDDGGRVLRHRQLVDAFVPGVRGREDGTPRGPRDAQGLGSAAEAGESDHDQDGGGAAHLISIGPRAGGPHPAFGKPFESGFERGSVDPQGLLVEEDEAHALDAVLTGQRLPCRRHRNLGRALRRVPEDAGGDRRNRDGAAAELGCHCDGVQMTRGERLRLRAVPPCQTGPTVWMTWRAGSR